MQLLTERLISSIRTRLGLPPALVTRRVLGRTVRVRHGSVRDIPDYDDGWMLAMLGRATVFIDAGCNLGWLSLLSCLENAARQVVCIDANPQALSFAAENLFINGYSSRIRFVQSFLSDQDGETVDFYALGAGEAGSRFASHARSASATGRTLHIASITLDSLCLELSMEPDLIKVDVEGAESAVLRGARQIASQFGPQFIVEMHATGEMPMKTNAQQVLAWCREVDFKAFYLKEHQEIRSSDPIEHRGRCHLLLQPSGQPYPQMLTKIAQGADLEEVYQLMRHDREGTF